MFFEEAQELTEYWSRNPPLRDLVAIFMGVHPKGPAEIAKAVVVELPEYE